MQSLGRLFVVFGGVLVVVGIVFMLGGKIPWLGRLPGDVYIQKKDFTFIFPLTTSIIASLVISAILYLIGRR